MNYAGIVFAIVASGGLIESFGALILGIYET